MVESFELSGKYSIVEIRLPQKFVGKSPVEIEFRAKYNLVLVTVIKILAEKSIFGKVKRVNEVQGVVNNDTPLEKGDILVLYGDNDDIKSFIRDSNSEE